jgi:hypothetical protein
MARLGRARPHKPLITKAVAAAGGATLNLTISDSLSHG